MPLLDAKFADSAKILMDADDEVLQTAGMIALMRLETLERRIKGISTGKAPLTPVPAQQDCAPKEEKIFGVGLTKTTPVFGSASPNLFPANFTPTSTNTTPAAAKENISSVTVPKSATNFGNNNVFQSGVGLKKESTAEKNNDAKNVFLNANTNDSFPLSSIGKNKSPYNVSLKEELAQADAKPLIRSEDAKKATNSSKDNLIVAVKPDRKSSETHNVFSTNRELVKSSNKRDDDDLRSTVSPSLASVFRENRTLEREFAQLDHDFSTLNFIHQQNYQSSQTRSWTFNAPNYHQAPLTLNNYILNIQQPSRALSCSPRFGGGGGGCGCRQIQCADRRCGCNKQGISCGSSCLCNSRGGWCLNR